MFNGFEELLEKYAEVTIKIGLNLQPNQRLLIGSSSTREGGAPIEAAQFVRAVTRQAYKAGARYVDTIWKDEQIDRIRFEYAPRDSFDEYPTWKPAVTAEYGKRGDAIMSVYASSPELLSDQDPELVSRAARAGVQYGQQVLGLIDKSAMNWLVVSPPIQGWADKVFSDLPAEERLAEMWKLVFKICRVDQPDPIEAWRNHIANLVKRKEYLTAKQYTALHYIGPNTDLEIGLPEGHIWHGAAMNTLAGLPFTANIPTEEVFTLPHSQRVNGVVTSTRPLFFSGGLMEDFSLTFEDGYVVKATAKRGEKILAGLLDVDEGARRLGEVALVPNSSPISQSGRLFYNTLYDENASCHVALGNAYRFTLENGAQMPEEEFVARGGNKSALHVDFMIGSGQLDIDGILANGDREPVFRQGEWAFDV